MVIAQPLLEELAVQESRGLYSTNPSGRRTTRKLILIPGQSVDLAEFIGIFLGDGGFGNGWQITISFNHRADHAYAEFIQALIRQLFGLEAAWRIRKQWGSADLVVSSIALAEFLQELGIPRGPKHRVITGVPGWIANCEAYRVACLRGLMDTDGCVYQHRYQVNGKWYAYPKLGFAGANPFLCQFVESSMRQLGLPAHRRQFGTRVFLDDMNAVQRYFKVVGTHNPRHRERFEKYAGEVPKWSTGAVC